VQFAMRSQLSLSLAVRLMKITEDKEKFQSIAILKNKGIILLYEIYGFLGCNAM
jgi:hypothetical protein